MKITVRFDEIIPGSEIAKCCRALGDAAAESRPVSIFGIDAKVLRFEVGYGREAVSTVSGAVERLRSDIESAEFELWVVNKKPD